MDEANLGGLRRLVLEEPQGAPGIQEPVRGQRALQRRLAVRR